MPIIFSEILPYLSLFLTVCVAVGGALAYRQSYIKTAGEIQNRVIAALKEETEVLTKKIDHCEKEISRQSQIIETIQTALKAKGIDLTINGDTVVIEETVSGTRKTTVKKSVNKGTTS